MKALVTIDMKGMFPDRLVKLADVVEIKYF